MFNIAKYVIFCPRLIYLNQYLKLVDFQPCSLLGGYLRAGTPVPTSSPLDLGGGGGGGDVGDGVHGGDGGDSGNSGTGGDGGDGGDASTPRGGSFTSAPTTLMTSASTCKTISVNLETAEEFDGVYVMVRACDVFVAAEIGPAGVFCPEKDLQQGKVVLLRLVSGVVRTSCAVSTTVPGAPFSWLGGRRP